MNRPKGVKDKKMRDKTLKEILKNWFDRDMPE